MAHYTTQQVISMIDESDLEAEEPSDQESSESEIEEDPDFPLPHSDSGTDFDESDDESPESPTLSPSVLLQSDFSPIPVHRGQGKCM